MIFRLLALFAVKFLWCPQLVVLRISIKPDPDELVFISEPVSLPNDLEIGPIRGRLLDTVENQRVFMSKPVVMWSC